MTECHDPVLQTVCKFQVTKFYMVAPKLFSTIIALFFSPVYKVPVHMHQAESTR